MQDLSTIATLLSTIATLLQQISGTGQLTFYYLDLGQDCLGLSEPFLCSPSVYSTAQALRH